jgi:hypothetical protein
MTDDLIFRFLDLDQFAKFSRLAGLAFANDFRVRLEHGHDFFLRLDHPGKDSQLGLFPDLLHSPRHRGQRFH